MSQFQKTNESTPVTPAKSGFNFLHDENGPIPVGHEHMSELYQTLDAPIIEKGEQSKRLKQTAAQTPEIDPRIAAFPGKVPPTDPKTAY